MDLEPITDMEKRQNAGFALVAKPGALTRLEIEPVAGKSSRPGVALFDPSWVDPRRVEMQRFADRYRPVDVFV